MEVSVVPPRPDRSWGLPWPGRSLLMTLCFGVVSVALERATRTGGPGSN